MSDLIDFVDSFKRFLIDFNEDNSKKEEEMCRIMILMFKNLFSMEENLQNRCYRDFKIINSFEGKNKSLINFG